MLIARMGAAEVLNSNDSQISSRSLSIIACLIARTLSRFEVGLSSLSVMSLASSLRNGRIPVGFLTNPTLPSGFTARRYGRLQVNCCPAALPAFRTERNVVPLQKVVIGLWTSMHPCRQVQLWFEACQLGGKFEVAALYRKDLFLQIED
jgi:hypothetical protein